MISIGVDIEDIKRFENKTLEKDNHFLKRIFTERELEYCFLQKNYAASLCARFCAKEATIKAVSNFYNSVISLNKIEVLKHENGAPYLNIEIDELKMYTFALSLSHEKEKAIAFVVVSK